jgi:hypothetical protein
MSETHTNWSKKEFHAYFLIYAARADLNISTEEEYTIHTIVGSDAYKNVINELAQDNDYQSIQKIMAHVEKFKYTGEDIDELFKDMKELFFTDGELDILEENMFMALRRLLK